MARKYQRRPRGEGSISQRKDGLWEAKIQTGIDAAGKRIRESVYAHSREELVAKINVIRGQVAAGTYQARQGRKPLLSAHMEDWLMTVVRPHRSEKTCEQYFYLAKHHILPVLGGYRVDQLDARLLQGFIAGLDAPRRKKILPGRVRRCEDRTYETYVIVGRDASGARVRQRLAGPTRAAVLDKVAKLVVETKLARKTQRGVVAVLQAALSSAVRWKYIRTNPLDGRDVEKPKVPRREPPHWSPAEAARVVAALVGDDDEAIVHMGLHGLRLGELVGLERTQLDLEAGKVRVDRQIVEVKGELIARAPKSAAGTREVPLSPEAVAALGRHFAKLDERGFKHSRHVFIDVTGKPLRQSNFRTRTWARILEKAGVPDITPHGMRHTFATLLLASGIDVKTVSELLGHSDPAMTLRVYAHALPQNKRAAAERLGEILTGKAAS